MIEPSKRKGGVLYEHITNDSLKKYYGTEPNITKALDGVTLSIEEGEFVAIVGTSGSGKSTLLNMMGGLDTPTSGSIKVKGKELSKLKMNSLPSSADVTSGLSFRITILFLC